MNRFLAAMLAGAAVTAARGDVVTKPIEYTHGATALEGVLVYDTAAGGKRPGVLLAHEYGPASAPARAKAGQLARLGYVVLSIDLYGKGVTAKDAADAASKLGLTGKDRTLIRDRIAAARAAIEKVPQVDPKRVAAVGYGVGGTAVLELARAKADVEGVACVHGDPTPTGNDGKNVGAPILVIVGAEDPNVSPAQLAAFEDEMRKGGVDWQLVRYGGVAGDFTNPQAGRNLKAGRAYDPDADRGAPKRSACSWPRRCPSRRRCPPQRPRRHPRRPPRRGCRTRRRRSWSTWTSTARRWTGTRAGGRSATSSAGCRRRTTRAGASSTANGT